MSEEINLIKEINYREERFYQDKNIINCFNGVRKDVKKFLKEEIKFLEKIEGSVDPNRISNNHKIIIEKIKRLKEMVK